MAESLAVACLLIAVGLARWGEYRLHARNYGYLTVSGAEELIPNVMRRYYTLNLVVVPAALAEWSMMPHQDLNLPLYLSGALLLIFGFSLKLWSIRTLGRQWTMRCLFVSGAPCIQEGPYQFIKHPEYLARFAESLGIFMILGCRWVPAVYVLLALRLTIEMMRVETRQLREFTGLEDPYPSVEN